jgi:epoxide hydrolase
MSEFMKPFRFEVSAGALADLHARIDRTRWPGELNDSQWSYGVRLDYLRELTRYWREQFDWPGALARINALPQFLMSIDGLEIHFVHARSPHPQATPLLITHGWPGSIVEFLALIPRLTDPERFGGTPADAFHVVAPSLQGYGGSPPATCPNMSPKAIAGRHVQLMQRGGWPRVTSRSWARQGRFPRYSCRVGQRS